MDTKTRIVIADDERPARSFLAAMLRTFDDVKIVGEAENGAEAVKIIERENPDLVLLDLQMPELDGLEVVRLLKKEMKDQMPLIAFVTAYDEYAVRAFELNAVDYLLKPVDKRRLREALRRAQERLEQAESKVEELAHLDATITDYETLISQPHLERIPIRQRDEIIIVPVNKIASIIADGELLQITTTRNENYTINYRLKDLELRLDPARFVRLGRGALANIDMIARISQMPGGTYLVTLTNNQKIKVSRLQSRSLRERLLRL
jgi:two-component system LytT family response regulator